MSFLNGLGRKFLRFCMDLTIYAYRGDFEKLTPNIIHKNLITKISQPVFYVIRTPKFDDSIFVVTRGAASTYDFQTILDMAEIETKYGTFHAGYYKAAKFVYDDLYPFFENLQDKPKHVYFVGHSYGGAVSASLILLFQNENYKAVVFGAPPVVDLLHSMKYENCIASFVADHDLIPTLSVPNIADQLRERIPDAFTPSLMNRDKEIHQRLTNEFNKILDSFDTEGVPAGKEVIASLKNAAPLFIDNVIQLIRDKLDKVVRYTPGSVFHITKMPTKSSKKSNDSTNRLRLIDCKVNPTDKLNSMSSFKSAVADHPPGSYESCLELLDE